jgi:two-component system, NtrC family, nitrogen regulation sensor histidine kinase NtrY
MGFPFENFLKMNGRTMQVSYLKMLGVAVAALALSCIFFALRHSRQDAVVLSEQFQEAILEKEDSMHDALWSFVAKYRAGGDAVLTDPVYLEELENLYEKRGMVLLKFDTIGEIVFWSHNSLPFGPELMPLDDAGAMRLQNGWYLYQRQNLFEGTFMVFGLVKHGFRYQNQFLINEFHEHFPVTREAFFLSEKPDEGFPVKNNLGNYIFSLELRREGALVQTIYLAWILALLLGIAAYLVFIYYTFRYFSYLYQSGQKAGAILGFAGAMIGFRMLLFFLQLPTVFYDGELFSPALYASSWLLPSLGDLFLNVLMVSIIAYFYFYHIRHFTKNLYPNRWLRRILAAALFGIIFLFCELAIYLIRGLVINSHLNLNINFIFNIDIYSLVGFLTIGGIFFAFFFFSVVICRLIDSMLKNRTVFWLVFGVAFLLFPGLHWIIMAPNYLLWLLFISAVLVFEMERKSNSLVPGFTSLVAALFLFSMISTVAIYRYNTIKEQEKRRSMALRHGSEQDPVAEFLFMEMEEALFNDNQLRNLVWRDPLDEAAIFQYLQHHYFYDFWAKYDMQITICSPGKVLLLWPQNVEADCYWFFEDYIRSFGKPTLSESLVYLDNNTGRNSYIAEIPIVIGDKDSPMAEYTIYLELDSKFVPRDMGFPELLIDQKVDISPELINYSYATYKNGNLINKYGPYNYSIHIAAYGQFDEEFSWFEFDDYHHLLFQKDDETQIIVSRPQETFLEKIAPFSYLFVLFFALVVIFWLLTTQRKVAGFFTMNFKRRVQFSMIGIVIASMVTIGGASAWFIFNIYQNKNISIISEKSHSVLVEMEHLMAGEPFIDEEWDFYLADLLVRFSNIFFTDINLFNPHGELMASSRPKVFEEGLAGNFMNPIAFSKLRTLQKSQYIHSEQIGNLEYLSAYVPLRNNQNQLLAYINLPYFAKQSELRNEISYFLVAFINIYLLLMVGAILLALFISNHVTSPLQVIRDNIARVQLGRTNQKIEWDRNDEIGSLISEYNRMIDELAVSADLLARSERESAWREMAKQVAHEIKNPLTPMRLSVQYLEKAWKEKVPDWDERLARFSKTMVEQIDNLSVIASAFSDFAKMPAGNNNRVDLRAFIPEVLDLYKDFEKVDMALEMKPGDHPVWIFADRNQLLRVFNNLIKNSIQAYDKNDIARIVISCREEKGWVVIEIRDYGCGISEAQKDSIFTPYFTTKTGGMGLGLSMVKNIIESIGGKVTFRSMEGQGTTFTLVIPEYIPAEILGE